MAHIDDAARVAESSTSTGTGAMELIAAYDGSYRRFNAVCAVGDTVAYSIIADDGKWECGIGTYSAASTLTRAAVPTSNYLNTNDPVVFLVGVKTVFLSNLGMARSTAFATIKAVPAAQDKLPYWDSGNNSLRAFTWSDMQAAMRSYLDTIYAPISGAAPTPAPTPAPAPAPDPITLQAESGTLGTGAFIGTENWHGTTDGTYVDGLIASGNSVTLTTPSMTAGLYSMTVRVFNYGVKTLSAKINSGAPVQFTAPDNAGTWANVVLANKEFAAGVNTITFLLDPATGLDQGYMAIDSVSLVWTGAVAAPPPPGTVPGDTVAVAAFVFGARLDGEYLYGIKPTGSNQDKDDAVKPLYDKWKLARLKDCPTFTPTHGIYAGLQITNAKYVDTNTIYYDNEGVQENPLTVSEAMGYGMLITVMMAGHDPEAKVCFDGLFRLVRGRPAYAMTYFPADPVGPTKYLMDWRLGLDTSHKGGGENACDGDEDIALALLMAHRQWGSTGAIDYLDQALKTIAAMKTVNFAANGVMHVKLVGSDPLAARSHDVSRTSDYMPQHFRAFKAATGDTFWDSARTNSLALTNQVITDYSPVAKMTPGWIWKPLSTVTKAQDPLLCPQPSPPQKIESEIEGIYDQNAFRNPWRWGTDFVLNNDAGWGTLASNLTQTIKTNAGNSINALTWAYKLDGTKYETGAGYYDQQTAACTMVGGMAGAHQAWVDACWTKLAVPATFSVQYFVGEPALLCMLVASGNWWKP